MDSLTNILSLFDQTNVSHNRFKSSKEDLKTFMKKNPSFTKEMFELTSLKPNQVFLKCYYKSQEDLREVKLIQTVLDQIVIERHKKINSLKTMKVSGLSLEHLSEISDMYALEGMQEFWQKIVEGAKKIIQKLIEILKRIGVAIQNLFNKVFKKSSSDPASDPELKKLIANSSSSDETISAFQTSIKPRDMVDALFKLDQEMTSLYNDQLQSIGQKVSIVYNEKTKQTKEQYAQLKEDIEKTIILMQDGISHTIGHYEKDFLSAMKVENKDMKASEFFTNDLGLYLISKEFTDRMANFKRRSAIWADHLSVFEKDLTKIKSSWFDNSDRRQFVNIFRENIRYSCLFFSKTVETLNKSVMLLTGISMRANGVYSATRQKSQ